MNQPADIAALNALKTERAALLDFLTLLEREQGMLVENDTDSLLDLSRQKTADALHLNNLVETRRALLSQHLPQLTIASVGAWLAKHSTNGASIWQEVLALTERARQLNQVNGQLIQAKLRNNQQALSVLSNAVNKANLYGPDGQPSFSPGSGRSLGSG